jgi:hypothetical protein
MARDAFFFPHALKPGAAPPDPPGRVPFDVVAHVTDGSSTWSEKVTVFADGYGRNTVGPNQDPCVLAAPQPFHSFCRINGTKRDDHVAGEDRLLSRSVKPGDLVIYGKFEPPGGRGPTSRMWVDTVLCVDRVERWTTTQRAHGDRCHSTGCKGRRFTLRDPAAFAARLTGMGDGAATDAYRLNLSDAEPNGFHCCTGLADYRVIVGRADRAPSAAASLATSFVPLAANDDNGKLCPASVGEADLGADWKRIVDFLDHTVRSAGAGPRGSWIARFPEAALAERLCMAIIGASELKGCRGVVALPPLAPARPLGRVGSAAPR